MREQYLVLSRVFRYPKEDYKDNVKHCMDYLERNYPDAASSFKRFADFISSKRLYEIEEIFGVTFHIQAICYLDIGYVLFGEDYSRGEFLVNMKREQSKANNDCGEELADNLPNVLKLLSISTDNDFVEEFSKKALIPAVEKMLKEFEAGRLALKNKVIKKKQKAVIMENVANGNIFQNPIQALLKVLNIDFKGIQYEEAAHMKIPTPIGLANYCGGGGCSTTNTKTIKA